MTECRGAQSVCKDERFKACELGRWISVFCCSVVKEQLNETNNSKGRNRKGTFFPNLLSLLLNVFVPCNLIKCVRMPSTNGYGNVKKRSLIKQRQVFCTYFILSVTIMTKNLFLIWMKSQDRKRRIFFVRFTLSPARASNVVISRTTRYYTVTWN